MGSKLLISIISFSLSLIPDPVIFESIWALLVAPAITEETDFLVYNQAKDANMVNFTGNTEFFSYIEKIDSLKQSISIKQNQIKNGLKR